MKITFLGTGTSQGVPIIACDCEVCRSGDLRDKRLRSSVLIEAGGLNLVIDTSPDFRQQMLRENVKRLEAVLYTHAHRDHIAGLDDIRAFNFIMKKSMDIYAEERVIRALKTQFPYIFAEKKYPGVPSVDVHIIDNLPFHVNGNRIMPVRAMHYRLPVLGFRIGDFTYLTDVKYISTEEKKKILGTRVLVLTALRRKEHISHLTLREALGLIEEVKPGKAYLTHISHQLGTHKSLMKELPPGIQPAFDGLMLELG